MIKRRFFYDTEFSETPNTIDLISIGVVGENGGEFYRCNKDADLEYVNPWVKENVLPLLPPRRDSIWRSSEEIAQGLLDFMKPSKKDPVELWGYFSAYDHVALCWLFGEMVELPPGMPMMTRDLEASRQDIGINFPKMQSGEHDALEDAKWNRDMFYFLQESVILKTIKQISRVGLAYPKTFLNMMFMHDFLFVRKSENIVEQVDIYISPHTDTRATRFGYVWNTLEE